LNAGGCGTIPAKALRDYVINDLKVKRGTYAIWLRAAIEYGFIMPEQTGDQEQEYYKLASWGRAAEIAGHDQPLTRAQYLKIGRFIKRGWLAWSFAAWIKSHRLENKQISRKAIRDLSGIPERNQRIYTKQAGIETQAHYAKDPTLPGTQEAVNYVNEYERGKIKSKAFLNNEQITWRRPNSYETKDIQEAPKGRLSRINRQLKDLLNNGGRDLEDRPIIRENCKSYKQIKASLRRIRDLSNQGRDNLPDLLYLEDKKHSGFSTALRVSDFFRDDQNEAFLFV
jgi:hypothetical protein